MSLLYVVMPAYNEEDNIRCVIEQWYEMLEREVGDFKLVVADSGSVDNTHSILMELKSNGYGKVEVLSDTLKQHGPKLIAMYKYAISNGAEFIFQTDSDGQTDPNEFATFWNKRELYDAILGHRNERGDGKSRAAVEKVVCMLLHQFFGVSVPDANAPYRLMRASLVGKYIDRFKEDYNLPNIMLTAFFAYYKDNISFEKISFKPRQAGVNSIDLKKISVIGIQAVKDFKEFKQNM